MATFKRLAESEWKDGEEMRNAKLKLSEWMEKLQFDDITKN
jgi:hypothetical protein